MGKNGVYKSNAPPIGNNKLHDEDELPENLKGKADEAENLSKSAAKNKKRREAAKKKQHEKTNNPANPGDKAIIESCISKKIGDKTQFTITRFHCIGRIETTKDLMNKYKRINELYGTTVFFLQDNNHPGHHILCIVM